MSFKLSYVTAGDLMTAKKWNDLIEAVNDTQERIELQEKQAAMPTGVLATVAGLAAASGLPRAKTTRRGFLGLNLFR